MSMNYKEVSRGLPPQEAAKYATGIGLVDSFVDSLRKQNLLPKRFVQTVPLSELAASTRETLPSRLKLIPFELEIPTVSEEVYTETRKAVEATIPDVFVVTVRPVTMEDLWKEDEQRGENRRLQYVNNSKTMRAVLPPEMEVFINPQAVRIEGSNGLPTDAQKARIAGADVAFKLKLPETVRPYVSLIMADPSTYSQLEDGYMDQNDGALLFPDFFARTDVQSVRGYVAGVGRYGPSHRRTVKYWNRGHGSDYAFAVPVGVLPRKLTT